MILNAINLRQNKGFTVVELLITLIMVIIVVGLSFSVYYYLIRGYDNVISHSDLRQSVRFAMMIIESRVANADSLEIFTDPPDEEDLAGLGADSTVIYIDQNGAFQSYCNGAGEDLSGILGDDVALGLSFAKEEGDVGGRLFGFEVSGTLGDKTYNMTSGLYLPNLVGEIVGNSGIAIVYTTVSSPDD